MGRLLIPTSVRDRLASVLYAVPISRPLLRWYAFHRSPIHVISYPKSGRTWLRFLIGVALQRHFGLAVRTPGDLLEINRLARADRRLPSVRFSHDDNPHLKELGEIERDKGRYRSKNVVLLCRDPRDVVVSSFYQQTRRARHLGEPGFEGTISEFLCDPHYGIENIVEFLNIWASNRHIPRRFQLVRYEDIVADRRRELVRVLDFIGVENPDVAAVDYAVELGSFEKMQSLERADALGSDRMRPIDPNDPTSFKVRRGVVGGFREELSSADREYVDGIVRSRLDPFFGYKE